MSINASINIGLHSNGKNNLLCSNIIQLLINEGWSLTHNNFKCYLPLHDNDVSNWTANDTLSNIELFEIIKLKEKQREVVGIMLTWQNTPIACDFLFFPENFYTKFSINLDANRPVINLTQNLTLTDFQWYLEKILPPINEQFGIEYFACEERH
jgi:hypothetical protein